MTESVSSDMTESVSSERISLDKELAAFLRMRAESYNMREPKLSRWIDGMSDMKATTQLLNSFLLGLSISPAEPCLDVGCGFGNLVIALSERFHHVSGIELNAERVEWAKKRCPSAEIVCGTAEALPWPDDHFELITSTDVFEHLDHSQQVAAARELARVLKPGGYAFVTVPSKYQISDEHNHVLFGTWMPDRFRRLISMRLHGTYLQCWEHSGAGWSRVFERANLAVALVPQKSRTLRVTTSRFHLFARKPDTS
jgi:ubiquinone/menaquinone biosynthesis C-methylase UbiE